MRAGDLEGALVLFERADRLLTNYPVLEINLGIVKSALGQEEAGRRHFERALVLDPGYAAGHVHFARWLADHGRGEEAIAQLAQALRISPNLVDARRLLVRLYAAAGQRDSLLRVANETLAISPGEEEFAAYAAGNIPFGVEHGQIGEYQELGMAQIARKNWLDAAIVFDHMVSLDPSSALAWNNLGWARYELGFLRSAADCFRRASEADPAMEIARNNLHFISRGRADK
jgi:tetratricopeptide (TPR) repeat protein